MKTILITGCSSGFGREIAKYFLERGDWKVVATMRTPREDVLPVSENLHVLPLDVTSGESIRQALESAGPLDALVSNAGIGLLNPLEGSSMKTVREVFETNTIGTIAMTQAVIPQMRERKTGVIVNVTSSVTFRPLPFLAVYTASKAAVNAFTESVALELEPFGVRVRIVLPGASPETSFAQSARSRMSIPEAYAEQVEKVIAGLTHSTGPVTYSSDVAEAVWQAITDASPPLRIPAGADAVMWSKASKS